MVCVCFAILGPCFWQAVIISDSLHHIARRATKVRLGIGSATKLQHKVLLESPKLQLDMLLKLHV